MNTEIPKTELTAEEIEHFASKGMTTRFDNEGRMVISNRAARRKKPPTPPHYTKSTHSLKKKRGQIK